MRSMVSPICNVSALPEETIASNSRGENDECGRVTGLAGITVIVALALAFAGAPLAQTTTTQDVRNFEVISVDGNKLVARDQNGAGQFAVPDDFRFTVDGKKVPVSELKPGMKGTATITTKTTVTPVVVTEIKEGVVLRAEQHSGDRARRRWSAAALHPGAAGRA